MSKWLTAELRKQSWAAFEGSCAELDPGKHVSTQDKGDRTVSRAVEFGGLQLIRRKSLTKHCLKLLVTEFLNLLLKETEIFMVCLVLDLFVCFKAAGFL